MFVPVRLWRRQHIFKEIIKYEKTLFVHRLWLNEQRSKLFHFWCRQLISDEANMKQKYPVKEVAEGYVLEVGWGGISSEAQLLNTGPAGFCKVGDNLEACCNVFSVSNLCCPTGSSKCHREWWSSLKSPCNISALLTHFCLNFWEEELICVLDADSVSLLCVKSFSHGEHLEPEFRL